MKTSGPKLHHYVPKFELSYFANDEMVWVYDRETGEIRRQNIRNTTAISNYYSFTLPSGETVKDLEEALSVAEGIAAPIIRKIDKGEWRLTPEERWEFSAYLALKWTRTPTQQRKIEALFEALVKIEARKLALNEEKFNKVMDSLELDTGEKIEDRESQRKFMLDIDGYGVETTRLTSLQMMVRNLKETYEVIYGMRWIFRYVPKGKGLVTSDNPFFVKSFLETDNPLGFGLFSPHTITFVTLTPRVCLTLINTNTGQGAGKMTGDMVNDLNSDIALFSARFVISHEEQLLKKIVERSKIAQIKPYKTKVEFQISPTQSIKVTKEK
jgi:hypothetical protein